MTREQGRNEGKRLLDLTIRKFIDDFGQSSFHGVVRTEARF